MAGRGRTGLGWGLPGLPGAGGGPGPWLWGACAAWSQQPLPLPLQKMVDSQRQNVLGEFERLRLLLAEEEQRLLQELEEEELAVLPRLREGAARLGQQSAQLAQLIAELEGRCQLPALGLLQVRWGQGGSPGRCLPRGPSCHLNQAWGWCSPPVSNMWLTWASPRTQTRHVVRVSPIYWGPCLCGWPDCWGDRRAGGTDSHPGRGGNEVWPW